MKLVAFNGFKESGKNTAARMLTKIVQEHYQTAKESGFAHKLKVWAALSLGHEGTDAELFHIGDALKHEGVYIATERFATGQGQRVDRVDKITGRQYLQFMGDQARHLFGENFWVDQLCPLNGWAFNAIWESILSPDGYGEGIAPDWALVTDLRYENEAQRVLALGGTVVEIVRPGRVSDGHASEQPLSPHLVSRTIYNDGDLNKLRAKIGGLWGSLDSMDT